MRVDSGYRDSACHRRRRLHWRSLGARLAERGHAVRGADVKPARVESVPDGVDARRLDLSRLDDCREAVSDVGTVYNLAADMGGMGFIETHKADVHVVGAHQHAPVDGGRDAMFERFFYASSACVYNAEKQQDAE